VKYIIFFIFAGNILIGQILPTVPDNVFRISIGEDISESSWDLNDNEFIMHGIGKNYFDYSILDEELRFSSGFDLYHSGSIYIDSINTIESWLKNVNSSFGLTLPIFNAQNINTSKNMSPKGIFSENRTKKVHTRVMKIDYGMSDEMTLHLLLPLIQSYRVDQNFSDYSIGKVIGAQSLIEYHQQAKEELSTYINSNNFNSLDRGIKDTLEMIFDMFYTSEGKYSVNWVFHSQDDPINNLLTNEKFSPPGIDKDSVSIYDLVSFYYPNQKLGSGLDDVKIGATVLLDGKSSWAQDGAGDAIYGRFQLNIPFGQTLSQFLDIGKKQFSQAKVGSGVNRWSLGLYASKSIISKNVRRIFFQSDIQFSTLKTLNTPVSLFSGMHTHPDSILRIIGNTYKYDMGTGFLLKTGLEAEMLKNRFRLRSEIIINYKGKDNYISNSLEWDNWMEEYSGNMPYFSKVELNCELWLLNSLSEHRIGPMPFDLNAGFKTTLTANNTYADLSLFSSITMYYQGW
tara:strand:- start:1927 stop:3462 length:1536 start_codon:yes stop_codon:yes gene_type:complete